MKRTTLAAALVVCTWLAAPAISTSAAPYDYKSHPVVAADPEAKSPHPKVWPNLPGAVVDGMGGGSVMPFANECYFRPMPTPEEPAVLTLDYGQPVSVAKFAIYFPRQGNQDIRMGLDAYALLPTNLEVLRSDDGKSFESAVSASGDDVSWTCPLVVRIANPKSSRYYRFVFKEMSPGSVKAPWNGAEEYSGTLRIYEIETYLDPADAIPTEEILPRNTVAQAAPKYGGAGHGGFRAKNLGWCGTWSATPSGLNVELESGKARLSAEARLLPDAQDPKGPWRQEVSKGVQLAAPVESGCARCRLVPEGAGVRMVFSMPPPEKRLSRRKICAKIRVPGTTKGFLPGRNWNQGDLSINGQQAGWIQPTVMAAFETEKGTLVVVPSTDLFYVQGTQPDELSVTVYPDAGEVSILLMPVDGDTWTAYQTVVKDFSRFSPVRQYRPVTQAITGALRWLMRDECWFKDWGTFRAFPAPPSENVIFAFYDTPYNIPAAWQRYLLTGDSSALMKAKSCVRFLIDGPMRIKSGPMKGCFYSQLDGVPSSYAMVDQAGKRRLTCHTTGAALWSMLYHRALLGRPDPGLDPAITEAADWLAQHQGEDGGWAYSYFEDGSVATGDAVGSGTIWNIWALYRAGNLLSKPEYVQAAMRAKDWWTGRFLKNHEYRGYWEDVGPGASREGYECSIAMTAFLEMGDKEGAVALAKDAAPFVQTRIPYYGDYWTSYGGFPEQTTTGVGYMPSFYCASEVGAAMNQVYHATKDPFWKPYGSLCKTMGRWSDPKSGAVFGYWQVNVTFGQPLHKGHYEPWYWVGWFDTHTASRAIWWLIDEINDRSGGLINVDREKLTGTILGQKGQAWLPDDAPTVTTKGENELNWMGYRTATGYCLAIINDHPSRETLAVVSTKDSFLKSPVKSVMVIRGSKTEPIESVPTGSQINISVPRGGMAMIEW